MLLVEFCTLNSIYLDLPVRFFLRCCKGPALAKLWLKVPYTLCALSSTISFQAPRMGSFQIQVNLNALQANILLYCLKLLRFAQNNWNFIFLYSFKKFFNEIVVLASPPSSLDCYLLFEVKFSQNLIKQSQACVLFKEVNDRGKRTKNIKVHLHNWTEWMLYWVS